MLVDHLGNVVNVAKAVPDTVRVDGDVARVVYVLVEEGEHHPKGDEGANEAVEGAEEGDHEGVSRVPEQDVPVKGRERVHAEAVVDACNNVEVAVVWRDPADPVELGQSGEDVVGEPEPDKHGDKHNIEELEARDAPNLAKGSSYWRVGAGMKSRVEGNGDERGGPHAKRRVDEKAAADTSNTIADKVCREGNEDLIGKVRGVALVKVLGQILDPDDVVCIGRVVGNVGHDCDEHMLLACKRSWVETVANAKESKAVVG